MDETLISIADNASQIPAAIMLSDTIARSLQNGRSTILIGPTEKFLPAQLTDFGLGRYLLVDSVHEAIGLGEIYDATVLVVFMTGSRLHEFIYRFQIAVQEKNLTRRPILITGYNGIVYEKHIEGVLWRTGSDLIAINSTVDLDIMTNALEQLNVDLDPLCVTGLLLGQSKSTKLPKLQFVRQVLFATQAVVPNLRQERLFLMWALRNFAQSDPDRTVIIKPRTRPGERTFYMERFPFEELDNELEGPRPENLIFEYGALSEYLEETDLVVSVSSTAVLEAISKGTAGAILTDLGIKESLGNHYFIGSGLLTSLRALSEGRQPKPNKDWFESHGHGTNTSVHRLVERVHELLKAQRDAQSVLQFRQQFYSAEGAQFIQGTTERAVLPQKTLVQRIMAKLFRTY